MMASLEWQPQSEWRSPRASAGLCSLQDLHRLQKSGLILRHSAGNCYVTSGCRECFFNWGRVWPLPQSTTRYYINFCYCGCRNWSVFLCCCTINFTLCCCRTSAALGRSTSSLILKDWQNLWCLGSKRNVLWRHVVSDVLHVSACVSAGTICVCALLCVCVCAWVCRIYIDIQIYCR